MSVSISLKACCSFSSQVKAMSFFRSVLSGADLVDRSLENQDRPLSLFQHVHKSKSDLKFDLKVIGVLRLFGIFLGSGEGHFIFLFSYLFGTAFNLLLSFLPICEFLRKHHQVRKFSPWHSQVKSMEVIKCLFSSKFFTQICNHLMPISCSVNQITLI